MLKTYRIIPLVFILFLFGFTLITVAPVLAQTTQELESRINALEELLCSLPKLATEEVCIASAKEIADRGKRAEQSRQRHRQRCAMNPDGPLCREMADPPPPKKFFCAKFPEALNYQECADKGMEACTRDIKLC